MIKKDTVTQQIERVQAFVATGKLSKYELAIRADVGVATLTGLETPDWNPLANTLSRLVRAIDRYESARGDPDGDERLEEARVREATKRARRAEAKKKASNCEGVA